MSRLAKTIALLMLAISTGCAKKKDSAEQAGLRTALLKSKDRIIRTSFGVEAVASSNQQVTVKAPKTVADSKPFNEPIL